MLSPQNVLIKRGSAILTLGEGEGTLGLLQGTQHRNQLSV